MAPPYTYPITGIIYFLAHPQVIKTCYLRREVGWDFVKINKKNSSTMVFLKNKYI